MYTTQGSLDPAAAAGDGEAAAAATAEGEEEGLRGAGFPLGVAVPLLAVGGGVGLAVGVAEGVAAAGAAGLLGRLGTDGVAVKLFA